MATPTDCHEGGRVSGLATPALLVVNLLCWFLEARLAHRMFIQIVLTHHRILLKAFSLLFGYRVKGCPL